MIGKSFNFSTLSGSMGGMTARHNRYAAIVLSAKSNPVDPNSVPQQMSRSAFGSGSAAWSSLPQSTRDEWEAYASTVVKQNGVGDDYIPTGRELFMASKSLQNYSFSRGFDTTLMDTAPSVPGGVSMTQPQVLPADLLETGFAVSIENPGDYTLKILAVISPRLSSSVNFYKGPYTSASMQYTVANSTTSAKIDFFGLEEGGKYSVRLRGYINSADPSSGKVMKEIYLNAIAVVGAP